MSAWTVVSAERGVGEVVDGCGTCDGAAAARAHGGPARAAGCWARHGAARGALGGRRRDRRRDLPAPGPERARTPGAVTGAEPEPGGGVVRFTRSVLRVRVAVGGAVFCGWDGAGPEPSYALAGGCPGAGSAGGAGAGQGRGWRVVSERVTVRISGRARWSFRTPGGLLLRSGAPPRWREPVGPADGRAARWEQRARLPADARVFGLGGRAAGPLLRGRQRTGCGTPIPAARFGPGDDPLYITMPVQLVVADAGCHLVFHDNTWDGEVTLRDGRGGRRVRARPAGRQPRCGWTAGRCATG